MDDSQPLQRNKEFLMSIGIYWPDEKRPFLKKLAAAIIVTVQLILLGFGWISSIVYIVKYVKYDPESALYALFQIAALFSVFYGMIATILCKTKVDGLLEKFRIIHNEGMFLYIILYMTYIHYRFL